jgi:hypothetical protein
MSAQIFDFGAPLPGLIYWDASLSTPPIRLVATIKRAMAFSTV